MIIPLFIHFWKKLFIEHLLYLSHCAECLGCKDQWAVTSSLAPLQNIFTLDRSISVKNVAVRDSWTKCDVWEWVGKLVGEGFTEEIIFEPALEVGVVVYWKVKGKHEKNKHMQMYTVQIMNGCLFCSLKWKSRVVQAHFVQCGVAHTLLRSSVINVKSEKGRFLNKGESRCLWGSVENGQEWERNYGQENNEETSRTGHVIESTP